MNNVEAKDLDIVKVQNNPRIEDLLKLEGSSIGHNTWLAGKLGKNTKLSLVRSDPERKHPAILSFNSMIEISKLSTLDTNDLVKKVENILLQDIDKSPSPENMPDIKITDETFKEFLMEINGSDFDLEKLVSWINEIKNKWIKANENWGIAAGRLVNNLQQENNGDFNVGKLTDAQVKFLKELLTNARSFISMPDVESMEKLLDLYPAAKALAALVHDGWREARFGDGSGSFFPNFGTDVHNFNEIPNLLIHQVNTEDRASTLAEFPEITPTLNRINEELTQYFDSNPQDNLSVEVETIVERNRNILHKDPNMTSFLTFALMYKIYDLFGKLKIKYANKENVLTALDAFLGNFLWTMQSDLNPATIQAIISADNKIRGS